VEYFRLDYPVDRLILCHRSQCDDIADSLESKEPEGRRLRLRCPPRQQAVCLSSRRWLWANMLVA
jgi:hypothetical protein